MNRKVGTTTYPIVFRMVLSSDHATPATEKTVSVALSKNGGAFGAAVGAVTEISAGRYALAGNATDRDTFGTTAGKATAADCDDCEFAVEIVSIDPFGIPSVSADYINGTAITPVTGNIPAEVKAFDATVQANLITAIWANATRTLTSLGTVVADTAAAVWAAVSRTITGGALTTAPPTKEEIRQEMDANSTELAELKTEVNKLVDGIGE